MLAKKLCALVLTAKSAWEGSNGRKVIERRAEGRRRERREARGEKERLHSRCTNDVSQLAYNTALIP